METMTYTPLNVDLKKMDYETFKTFMYQLIATLISKIVIIYQNYS